MRPESSQDLAEAVAAAREPFELLGAGTKRGLGQAVAAQPLDLSTFNTITAYEPEELILEAGPAATLAQVEQLLQPKNQMLAFEPPDFSKLLGTKHAGTLGGVVSCNLSGPRRLTSGAARDHMLGIKGVNGLGEVFKSGARVVKNVTGYDLPRLIAGSYGTLAALTSIIVKVLPRPESELTLMAKASTMAEALALMTAALQSSCEVSSAAFVPGQGVALRIEGTPVSVAYRADKLQRLSDTKSERLSDPASQTLWQAIRDVEALQAKERDMVWRLSVAPSEAPGLIAALQAQFSFRFLVDWAGGLLWLTHAPEENAAGAIRQAVGTGHAMLFRADKEMRARIGVFQPQPPALQALNKRVKQAFDPKGLFNPGRMTGPS